MRPTRAAARRLARHLGSLRDACRSYLVLLPVGFSLPPPLPAARCALAAPFHPYRPPGVPGRVGGVLSVALSLGSPPPGVTRHRASVEPGLSSPRKSRRAAIQPSGTERFGLSRRRCQRLLGFRRSWTGQPRDDQSGFPPDWSPCPSPQPSPRTRKAVRGKYSCTLNLSWTRRRHFIRLARTCSAYPRLCFARSKAWIVW